MIEPSKLRELITKFHPNFNKNPDSLLINVVEGGILHTFGNPTFTNKYVTAVHFMEYQGTIEAAIIPILHFLETYHPDIVLNVPAGENIIDYKSDIIDEKTINLSMAINISELIKVNQNASYETIPAPMPTNEFYDDAPSAALKDLIPAPFDNPDY